MNLLSANSILAVEKIQVDPSWVSLVPPLLAIILAIWWKEVISALLVAVLVGMMLLATNPVHGIIQTIDPLILSTVSDVGNVQVILFTMFLGAMIGVMSGSGGSHALVVRLTKFVQSRRQGQLTTWLLGLAIFFDDYGNTLLVGSTMQPITDRLKISRQKLAYIVDSTAAPVAGLALVSTWVAVEVGYLKNTYSLLGLPTENIYQTFIATLPYRFYPVLALIFVGQIIWSRRDFGPMLKAETEAISATPQRIDSDQDREHPRRLLEIHAIIPLVVLCACMGITLSIDFESSSRALLLSSFAAAVAVVLSVVISRTATLSATMTMAIQGMQQMLPAILVLVLAWSIGSICDPDHLNTAGYLVNSLGDQLSPHWLPLLTFLLAAITSFATGTSFGTMGLLIPLCVGIEYELLSEMQFRTDQIANHPLMLGTIGAVLGGAIFGDHCSPISDTTVLSSAATGCEHLSHVKTQLPYALTVAVVAIVIAYLPVAFGVSPYLSILAAILVQWGVIRILGKVT
ncbi:hypothetical protein OAF42_00310 [Planctomicrobium sp.]|nr:hypothetical protein [Planctomicrobium sp.]MDB4732860.1 hypothetical protein [Planctomicrobium sp.]